MKFVGLIDDFKILVFQTSPTDENMEEDMYLGFVQTTKNFIMKENKKIDHKLESLKLAHKNSILEMENL